MRCTVALAIGLGLASLGCKDKTQTAGDPAKEGGDPAKEPAPECPAAPYATIELPASGRQWLSKEERKGDCSEVGPTGKREHQPIPGRSASGPFQVDPYGPEGADRRWNVVLSRGEGTGAVCLATSTGAYRTILGSATAEAMVPLSWARDLDGDGNDELILWTSQPIEAGADPMHHALMPWVYRATKAGFELAPALSRAEWKGLAGRYREAAAEDQREVREKVAAFLDKASACP